MNNKKKKNTNTLIIIVAIIFVLSLISALIILLKTEDKKDKTNGNTTSTVSTTSSTSTSATMEIIGSTNNTKTTATKTTKSTTKGKETTTKKKTSEKCDLDELERIANANHPDQYAVWKTKPTFNVPSNIVYGIGYQKFFWMWCKIGTVTEGGVTKPKYIWVVASDKESGSGYPKGVGNTIHEINPSGHFKNAMKYMIPKPTDEGTKEGERRGVISLYYYDGTTYYGCN